MFKSVCYVNIDKPQCNVGSLNPYDFTRKFAKEPFIHGDSTIITNCQRAVKMHKSATQRDIPNNASMKRISQVQKAVVFAIESFVKSITCHGTFLLATGF
jgi:phage terminase large subunit-like protein